MICQFDFDNWLISNSVCHVFSCHLSVVTTRRHRWFVCCCWNKVETSNKFIVFLLIFREDMDERISKRSTSYDRVMPRVYTRSRPNPKANTEVTRHGTSATRVGAKESSSNISSSVFCELPLVLGDYEPERPVEKPKVLKAKPRKTIKSLDPGKSPHSVRNQQELKNNRTLRVRNSAPCVIDSEPMGWSDSHLRQCYSSRSHTRLKELKV